SSAAHRGADARHGTGTRLLQAGHDESWRRDRSRQRRRPRLYVHLAPATGRRGRRGGVHVKVYLRTFGCRANQYDSEQVRTAVTRAGGEIVDDPAAADVAVFNSCAVTAEAEVDLRKNIRRVARRNPALRSVVMGCAAALDDGRLRDLPTVAEVVGGGDVLGVAAALGLDPAPLRSLP